MAYQELQRGIADGTFPPGTWLREEDVAARTGVSRTPVREALRQLHAERLIDIQPNRGALVMGWSAADLDDIFELRILVEGYAARTAALNGGGGPATLAELLSTCDAMDQLLHEPAETRDARAITELNLTFHMTLARSSDNRQLVNTLAALIQVPIVSETFAHYSSAELRRSHAQHLEIVEAIAASDHEWAESVMRAHICAARASLRRLTEAESERRASR